MSKEHSHYCEACTDYVTCYLESWDCEAQEFHICDLCKMALDKMDTPTKHLVRGLMTKIQALERFREKLR